MYLLRRQAATSKSNCGASSLCLSVPVFTCILELNYPHYPLSHEQRRTDAEVWALGMHVTPSSHGNKSQASSGYSSRLIIRCVLQKIMCTSEIVYIEFGSILTKCSVVNNGRLGFALDVVVCEHKHMATQPLLSRELNTQSTSVQ